MVRTTAVLFLAVQLGLAAVAQAQQPYNSVTLAWDANTEPDLAGYIVYWGNGSRTYDRSFDVGNVTQYTINGLEDLQTYYFAVRAYNSDGLQSAYSSEVSKIIPLNPDRVLGIRTRLYWRNTTNGGIAAWHMDGNRLLNGGAVSLGTVTDQEWRLVGAGDFNRDGHTDLVWHHNTQGWISIWTMAGDTRISAAYATPDRVVDTDWRIAGVGDFDGDGGPDLLWHHRVQGTIAVWIMRGTTLANAHNLTPSRLVDTNWKIVGTGDYDRDGHVDLFWRHLVTGAMAVWRLNRSTMVSASSLTPATVADQAWQVVAVTDFNGDGRPDLVWQHDGGSIGTWIMNGSAMTAGPPLIPGSAPVGWRIVGAGR
jgi:hypothetical protein